MDRKIWRRKGRREEERKGSEETGEQRFVLKALNGGFPPAYSGLVTLLISRSGRA